MKIALLSNVTVEVLAKMIEEGQEVWTPPGFGAWAEVALNPPGTLREFGPDVVCILLDERFSPPVDAALLASARHELEVAFPGADVLSPRLDRLLADLGEAAYDERMWALAKMPWAMASLLELKKLFTPLKKVLALDLDNTLWKGVVSEDGAGGIVPDAAFQREVLSLKERGVVLVALSRNNLDDLAGVWTDPRMILHKDDFAASRVDWNAKSANLADVARELNLCPDSFVFVDDDPVNRAEMRASRPEVAVAPFPPDLPLYFHIHATTDEDRARARFYREESLRRKAFAGRSYDDYIRSLKISADVHELGKADISRVAQLSQKANQFNVRTNRWTVDDIRAFAADPSRLLLTMRVSDRFGDLGLVAFVHAKQTDDSAEIVDWVMSCRAMNRRVEFVLERTLEESLVARGVRRLAAEWHATAKNSPVGDLFDAFGFSRVEDAAGCRRYMKPLASAGDVGLGGSD